MDMRSLRRQYGALSLDEASLPATPLLQCEHWLAQAIETEQTDPTAMVLSTIDEQGQPDARVVLLKGLEPDGFIFYTHYQSAKGRQLAAGDRCALTFYWPVLVRQLRIQGRAIPLESSVSAAYFVSRPYLSQLSAMASPQSQVIANRQMLEDKVLQLQQSTVEGQVHCPSDWGGYRVVPHAIEFWQGRDNRLHDRILYTKQGKDWSHCRLAP
ncbi:MAG: pyridoxamine 5'-phosphate oxidase [Gammaproteobacteria bacterium]|nr:pyridoxamine 5'-phosphate oxidase [Gammaproteobacteria bacterium]